MPELSAKALALIDRTHLRRGEHAKPEDGMCAMELVSFIAGEPFSDHPNCVCPVLGLFVRAWNDGLEDDERDTILKPVLPRLIGTRGSDALAIRRVLVAADWLIRIHTPTLLRLAKLDAHADALEELPEIASIEQAREVLVPIEAARVAAARGAIAGGAAYDAWAVAVNGAAIAIWAAAGAVSWGYLKDTANMLQLGISDLFERMVDAKDSK